MSTAAHRAGGRGPWATSARLPSFKHVATRKARVVAPKPGNTGCPAGVDPASRLSGVQPATGSLGGGCRRRNGRGRTTSQLSGGDLRRHRIRWGDGGQTASVKLTRTQAWHRYLGAHPGPQPQPDQALIQACLRPERVVGARTVLAPFCLAEVMRMPYWESSGTCAAAVRRLILAMGNLPARDDRLPQTELLEIPFGIRGRLRMTGLCMCGGIPAMVRFVRWRPDFVDQEAPTARRARPHAAARTRGQIRGGRGPHSARCSRSTARRTRRGLGGCLSPGTCSSRCRIGRCVQRSRHETAQRLLDCAAGFSCGCTDGCYGGECLAWSTHCSARCGSNAGRLVMRDRRTATPRV